MYCESRARMCEPCYSSLSCPAYVCIGVTVTLNVTPGAEKPKKSTCAVTPSASPCQAARRACGLCARAREADGGERAPRHGAAHRSGCGPQHEVSNEADELV